MAEDNIQGYDNIRTFKKKKRINLFLIIFMAILVYVIIVVIIYLKTTHTVRYEVVEGSLASNTIYRGVILREEIVVNSDSSGYVNYLAREGQRVAVGDLVYTVDETGTLNDYIEAQSLGENTLSDKELAEFRSDIINYIHSYDSENFDTVYDFKYSLKNTVIKLANTKLLDNMDEAAQGASSVSLNYCYAHNTGIVSYWIDGYEDLKISDINESIFDEKKYDKNQFLSNKLRTTDEAVYKLSCSENWSIVFPISEALGQELLEEDYILVKFLKNQEESWGKVNLLNNADGTYLQLSFTNSMVTFVDERFLDIELKIDDETGLKIPVSSIAEKEFFLIDGSYIKEDSNGNSTVLMRTFGDDGSITASAVSISVYYYDDTRNMYYVDDSVVSAGDILYGTDETTFVVRDRGTLIGVYNINKGYADFKQITILYQNDEYAIVKSNTTYGLRVYDYIALDADTVDDDQFIVGTK